MFIKKITVKNFCGFKEREFEFNEKFSVIAGTNGSGKTSVLKAVRVALSGFLTDFGEVNPLDKKGIEKDEIRTIVADVTNASLPQTPVTVHCEAVINDETVSWDRSITAPGKRNTTGSLGKIRDIAKSYREQIYSGYNNELILPVLVYFSASRLWNVSNSDKTINKNKVRLEGYQNSLNFTNSIRNSFAFIKKLDYLTYKGDKIANEKLIAIFSAIKISCADVVSVDYAASIEDLVLSYANEKKDTFSNLSDGYRSVIELIIDICSRMLMLNPQLGKRAITETPGVVLIDEIDLHLHPKWQRKVVSDLKKIFPKVQFIATTHSPFIIQSLEAGELISLNEEICSDDYVNEGIEDITENVMGVENPRYSHEREEMYETAKKFYSYLDDTVSADEITKTEEKLKLLTAKYSDDVAYYAFLEQKLSERKIELGV